MSLREFDFHHLCIESSLESSRQLLEVYLQVNLVPFILPFNTILIEYVALKSEVMEGEGFGRDAGCVEEKMKLDSAYLSQLTPDVAAASRPSLHNHKTRSVGTQTQNARLHIPG